MKMVGTALYYFVVVSAIAFSVYGLGIYNPNWVYGRTSHAAPMPSPVVINHIYPTRVWPATYPVAAHQSKPPAILMSGYRKRK